MRSLTNTYTAQRSSQIITNAVTMQSQSQSQTPKISRRHPPPYPYPVPMARGGRKVGKRKSDLRFVALVPDAKLLPSCKSEFRSRR